MSWLDQFLIVGLALWALGSVLFILRVPGIWSWLRRWDRSLFFTEWSVFSPANQSLRPGVFEVHFRDRETGGVGGDWRVGAVGRCESWRGFFWLPQRPVAAAVQNLGREIRAHVAQRPPRVKEAIVVARVLEAFVDRRHPRAPATVRDLRIVRRFASDDTMEMVLEYRGLNDVG